MTKERFKQKLKEPRNWIALALLISAFSAGTALPTITAECAASIIALITTLWP